MEKERRGEKGKEREKEVVRIEKLRVLFVCSGNSKTTDISPIVKAQGETLEKVGVSLDYYPVKGKGVKGYLSNVKPLREYIKKDKYDLIHAHYSLCGVVSSMATSKPVIVSLMGSDVNSSVVWRKIIHYCIKHKWVKTIVKSDDMQDKLGVDNVYVIPNGVNLELFKEMDKFESREKLGLEKEKKIIIFGADPKRSVKNFPFAQATFSQLTTHNSSLTTASCNLLTLGKISHEQIPIHINAADVLILASKWEGSPNIIKEAMACNCLIVSTDVGDVNWLLGDVEGHYIADNKPEDFADKIKLALGFGKRTKGRERLIELGLDSGTVAKKLFDVYQKVLGTKGLRDIEKKRRRD